MDIFARFGGQNCYAGSLGEENGRPVFVQRLSPAARLRIFNCAGVDVEYSPRLPEGCLIRHVYDDGKVYEIALRDLQEHPKTIARSVGVLHPLRLYLDYYWWRSNIPKTRNFAPAPQPPEPLQASLF